MKIDLIEADAPLTLQTHAALVLNSTNTERDLRAMAIKNVTITQVIDKVSRQQCHSAAMELKTARTTIAKVSKDAREDATAFQKAIIAEEKRLISIVEPEEIRLIGLRDDYDAVQERIKREEEARERARITAIHERIGEIRSFSGLATQCRTAARVSELLVKLQAIDMGGFEEFSEEAATVHAATVSGVTFVHDEKIAEEVERARVKAQQEADAAALEAKRIEQANEAAKLAAERAAIERERAELAAAKAAAAQAIEDAKPKIEPVDAYEQELQAFAAVVAPHPVSSTGAASEPIKADLPHTPKATRPTDMAIVEVLALHYRVHESKVLDWLLAMDLDAVTEAIVAEFI